MNKLVDDVTVQLLQADGTCEAKGRVFRGQLIALIYGEELFHEERKIND